MAVLKTMAAVMAAATFAGRVAATEISLPPCLDPFQPFVYSGCFEEPQGTQILPYRSPAQSNDMTVEKCVAECKGNGYRYAGLVYYGVCYCGQSVQGLPTGEEKCNFPCNGNSSQTCGANGVFSIYQDPTFIPIEQVTIKDFDPLGCWTGSGDQGRALSYRQNQLDSATLTTEKCLQACRDGGFPFAGTEFGGECYCGVVIGNGTYAAPQSECDMPCNGNSNQKCGGRGRLNLFVADELLSLQPCGYKPPISSSSVTTSVTRSTTSTSTVAPSTTSTSLSTVTPPPSSTKPVSSTKTSSTVCVTTSVIPPTCEYKCGKWCSSPLPDWNNDVKNCKAAWSNCALQVASCFKNAGWPASLECFNFGAWCSDVERYCNGTPKGKKSDFCGKKPPVGPSPPKTTVITTACPATSTKPASTSTKPASTTKPASATTKPASTTTKTVCIPTPTNICKQPSNPSHGYGPGKPVGGIALPIVTCNDLISDWPNYPFKGYTSPDTRKCKKYQRDGAASACADACKEQYEDCLDVYAEGCRNNRKPRPRSYFDFAEKSEIEKRTWGWTAGWTDNYSGATNKCKLQYNDCLNTNKYVDVTGKCLKPCCGW